MDQVSALLIARAGLASVFLVAGIAKLWDRSGSRAAMAGFGVPRTLAAPLAVALPVLEVVVAIALIPPASARWGALSALALLGVFVGGITNVMIRGRKAECRCFGQLQSSSVGWTTLIRNLALVVVAGFVAAGGRGLPRLSYLEWMLAGLLAAGGWASLQLLRQHGRILLRLDALEVELAARGIIARPDRAGPADGLAPGVPAPRFALADVHGDAVTLDDLLAPGLPLMLVFSHPGCTPCVAMLPEVGHWQRAHAPGLSIALLSEGSPDDNRAAALEHGIARVLLQSGREVAEAYEAYATPSAVMISSDGLIASAVVQGAAAIRAMRANGPAAMPANGHHAH